MVLRFSGSSRRKFLKWFSASLLAVPFSHALPFATAASRSAEINNNPFNLRFKKSPDEYLFVERESDLLDIVRNLENFKKEIFSSKQWALLCGAFPE